MSSFTTSRPKIWLQLYTGLSSDPHTFIDSFPTHWNQQLSRHKLIQPKSEHHVAEIPEFMTFKEVEACDLLVHYHQGNNATNAEDYECIHLFDKGYCVLNNMAFSVQHDQLLVLPNSRKDHKDWNTATEISSNEAKAFVHANTETNHISIVWRLANVAHFRQNNPARSASPRQMPSENLLRDMLEFS